MLQKRIKKIGKIFIILLVFSMIYMITFHLPWRNIIPVYTYFGIISLFIVTIFLILFLFAIYRNNRIFLDKKDCIIVSLLFFSIHIFVFCMIPVTIERSISVFMLRELQGNPLTKEEMEKAFIDKYVYEYGAFSKRIKEQKYTGTIKKKGDSYGLSAKGKFMMQCFYFIKKIYRVEGKILT